MPVSPPADRFPDDLGITPIWAGDGRFIGWSFWERYADTVYNRRLLYAGAVDLVPRRPRRWWWNQ